MRFEYCNNRRCALCNKVQTFERQAIITKRDFRPNTKTGRTSTRLVNLLHNRKNPGQ